MNVVAGVLERDGRVLICQRKRGGQHPLRWEFPGGKEEDGEEPQEALARELREELGIDARIGEEIGRYDVRYGNSPAIRLVFYRVTDFTGEPENLDFETIVWEKREDLLKYNFLEGDADFVKRLASGKA